MRPLRKLSATLVGVAAMLVGIFVLAGPAAADGSVSGIYCGDYATFNTVNGVAQVQYIVDSNGQKDATHNGGCFGVAPSGSIWWTPRTNPNWREMPGNGVARWAAHSYIGVVCAPDDTCMGAPQQIISVQTSAANYYAQYWVPGSGWNGVWKLNTQ
jgi:hypothetical protein